MHWFNVGNLKGLFLSRFTYQVSIFHNRKLEGSLNAHKNNDLFHREQKNDRIRNPFKCQIEEDYSARYNALIKYPDIDLADSPKSPKLFLTFSMKYIFFIHTGSEYIALTDYRYSAYRLPSFLFFPTFLSLQLSDILNRQWLPCLTRKFLL